MKHGIGCLLFLQLSCGAQVPDGASDGPDPVRAQTDMSMAVNLPAGVILPYAGPQAPQGWWPCDGRAINAMEYPALFNAIGSSWGDGGDGAGPLYNIPDLRGVFLRGVDNGSGRDPDRMTRTALTQGGNTGDRVGSYQDGATAMPKNPFAIAPTDSSGFTYEGNGKFHSFVTPQTVPKPIAGGDSETRPRNVNINYIIKY